MINVVRLPLQLLPLFILVICVHTYSDRCRIFEFRCSNSKCIHQPLRCNGQDDCGDNSDEAFCKENIFHCSDSKVIPISSLCDGTNDCSNDEDTKICEEHRCSKDHFLCRKIPMTCIDINDVCNNVKDCADEADESPDACDYVSQSKIAECNNATQFRCANKQLCISKIYHCDGNDDCTDKSDERNCSSATKSTPKPDESLTSSQGNSSIVVCSSGDFDCGLDSTRRCIPKDWTCDSSLDCGGANLDEENCPNFNCPAFKPRQCTESKICYEEDKHCDGEQNCPDASDEKNCPKQSKEVICNPIAEYKCFKKNKCIPLAKVCDKNNDCEDGSDERPGGLESNCQKNPCANNNGGCDQECVSFFSDRKCYCRPGYEVSSTNSSKCVDVDECSRGTPCSHICQNTEGSYECNCFGGFYKVKSNSSLCVAAGEKFLLFSTKDSIRELRLLHHHVEELVSANQNQKKLQAIGIDFDYKLGYIFWTQFEPRAAIVKISYRSSNNQDRQKNELVNTNIHSPTGIAFDWIHGLLFWTDSFYQEISVLNVSTGDRRLLLKLNDSKLRSIVVHPKYKRLYWTDWGTKPRIMSMGTDGQDIKTIVDEGLMTPNGLAIDYYLNELYWVDARGRNIKSYHLKTKKQREVVTHLDAHGFSLDVFEDWLYLSDWHNQNILQVHKITGEVKLLISTPKPLGIKLMHQLAQPENIENVCTHSPCQRLCLPSAFNLKSSAQYRCQCPDNSELLSDGIRCSSLHEDFLGFSVNNSRMQKMTSNESPSGRKVIQKRNIYLVVAFVTAILLSVLVFLVIAGILMYRNYIRKVIKRATNFNNPIYHRKTSTHDLQLLNMESPVEGEIYDIPSSALIINQVEESSNPTQRI